MTSMLSYIESQPQSTQRLLGIKYEQLQILISRAIQLESEKLKIAENKKVRIIASGGGRKPKLSSQEQIILTLTYLRHLTTFQLLGVQFGVSETTANRMFNYWLPILGEILPASLLEQVKKTKVTTK
jgi:hypothetical protein